MRACVKVLVVSGCQLQCHIRAVNDHWCSQRLMIYGIYQHNAASHRMGRLTTIT